MLSHNQLPIPPASTPLAFIREAHENRTPSLLLLTGDSGVGKTAWCQAIYTYARRHNWTVAGLISPPVMANGRKMAIDLQDLRTGQRRRLATRIASPSNPQFPIAHPTSRMPQISSNGEAPARAQAVEGDISITTGQWQFNPRTIRWGNTILSNPTVETKTSKPKRPDLVIIDELGPLEFRQHQGLQAGIKLVDAWRSNLICVTIRPSLVGAARMRWPWGHIIQVEDADIHIPDSL